MSNSLSCQEQQVGQGDVIFNHSRLTQVLDKDILAFVDQTVLERTDSAHLESGEDIVAEQNTQSPADIRIKSPLDKRTTEVSGKAIFGMDDRVEESQVTSEWRAVGASTAMLLNASGICGNALSAYTVCSNTRTLGDATKNCNGRRRFREQVTPGSCSGTLIASDRVATAGHCLRKFYHRGLRCSDFRVMFNATNTALVKGRRIPTKHVYRCAEVLAGGFSEASGLDWAVFRLDRAVPSSVARPAVVSSLLVNRGDPLVIIGHPSGLPRKYADDASVLGISDEGRGTYHFSADLDAFAGNSGSGVFNQTTREMVGILVAGFPDYDGNGCEEHYPAGLAGEVVSGAVNLFPWANNSLLDVGGIGGAPNQSDALIIARYLFGIRDEVGLLDSIPGNPSFNVVTTNIARTVASGRLNVDGSGGAANQIDGLMIARYLFGIRDAAGLLDSIPGNPSFNAVTTNIIGLLR